MTARHSDALLVQLLAQQPQQIYCGLTSDDEWPDLRTAIELRGGEYLALAVEEPGEPTMWNVATTACPLRASRVLVRGNGSRDLLWVGPDTVLKPVGPGIAALAWCCLLCAYPDARLQKSEIWAAATSRAAARAADPAHL